MYVVLGTLGVVVGLGRRGCLRAGERSRVIGSVRRLPQSAVVSIVSRQRVLGCVGLLKTGYSSKPPAWVVPVGSLPACGSPSCITRAAVFWAKPAYAASYP